MTAISKVFVVMGGDYPAAVFTNEKAADDFIQVKKAEDKNHGSRIYWRSRDFDLQGDAETTQAEAEGSNLISILADALRAAEEHLEFCGYGDAYERECADAQKIPEKIDAALEAAKVAGL